MMPDNTLFIPCYDPYWYINSKWFKNVNSKNKTLKVLEENLRDGKIWFWLCGREGFIFYPHLRTCLLILERGEGRKRERERNINVKEKYWSIAPCPNPSQGWPHNPGMCPDQELNLWTFGLQEIVPTKLATLARVKKKMFT